MGFSSSLQGATSHDAILQRVDAELRLLENMKRCLTARVKGQLISEDCLQMLQKNQRNILQISVPVSKKWSNQKKSTLFC